METETKPQALPLRRIAQRQFSTYAAASDAHTKVVLNETIKGDFPDGDKSVAVVKKKIFARNSGVFDLVLYARAGKEEEAKKELAENTETKDGKKENKVVHGLTAKQRRAQERK